MTVYLRRVVARDFPEPAAIAADPGHRAHLREYLSDLAAPYGTALREDMFAAAHGQSYGEMAEALLRDVVPGDEAVDLLVLAFAVPDIRPGRATATYLSHICPGNPFAFAICDQGSAAAFTGLRLIRDYGDLPRAVLLVVEQAAMHHEPAMPAAVPAGHSGVAVLTGTDGPVWLREVRQHAGVAPEDAWGLVGGDDDAILLAGPGLAAPGPHRGARAGRPLTGLWAALADELHRDHTPRSIRLADYDPLLRYLCASTVDVHGGAEPRGGARDARRVELGAA
jgi:hypothetical protein